jgi:hypothetical protein
MSKNWESSSQRAKKDFKDWLRNHIAAQPLSFFVPGAGTMLVTYLIPSNVSIFMATLYGFIGGAIGLGLLYLIVYLVQLAIAPYRQRNEAYKLISELRKDKVIIPNKDTLIRAISHFAITVRDAFVSQRLVEITYIDKPLSVIKDSIEIKDVLNKVSILIEAKEALDTETLVSGQKVSNIVSPLVVFAIEQVVNGGKLRDILHQFIDSIPKKVFVEILLKPPAVILIGEEFTREFDNKVKETIRQINEIAS